MFLDAAMLTYISWLSANMELSRLPTLLPALLQCRLLIGPKSISLLSLSNGKLITSFLFFFFFLPYSFHPFLHLPWPLLYLSCWQRYFSLLLAGDFWQKSQSLWHSWKFFFIVFLDMEAEFGIDKLWSLVYVRLGTFAIVMVHFFSQTRNDVINMILHVSLFFLSYTQFFLTQDPTQINWG